MPSPSHETLVAFLARRPDFLDALLVTLGFRPLPANLEARDAALRVANPLEVRPDLVLLDGADTGPWAIVEVQLGRDEEKQRRWLAAAGVLLDTRGTMGDVVVLTHDAGVARWAATIATVEGPGGTTFALRPIVVRLTRAEVDTLLAAGRSELALFAAWAVHDQSGQRAKKTVREVAQRIVEESDSTLQKMLWHAMVSMLGDPLLTIVRETDMNRPTDFPLSPAGKLVDDRFREVYGMWMGADCLLQVLSSKGLPVSDALRSRILACRDLPQMKRWFSRSLTATSIDEVFAD